MLLGVGAGCMIEVYDQKRIDGWNGYTLGRPSRTQDTKSEEAAFAGQQQRGSNTARATPTDPRPSIVERLTAGYRNVPESTRGLRPFFFFLP